MFPTNRPSLSGASPKEKNSPPAPKKRLNRNSAGMRKPSRNQQFSSNDPQQAPSDISELKSIQTSATVSLNSEDSVHGQRSFRSKNRIVACSNGKHVSTNESATMNAASSSSKKLAIENEKKGNLAY